MADPSPNSRALLSLISSSSSLPCSPTLEPSYGDYLSMVDDTYQRGSSPRSKDGRNSVLCEGDERVQQAGTSEGIGLDEISSQISSSSIPSFSPPLGRQIHHSNEKNQQANHFPSSLVRNLSLEKLGDGVMQMRNPTVSEVLAFGPVHDEHCICNSCTDLPSSGAANLVKMKMEHDNSHGEHTPKSSSSFYPVHTSNQNANSPKSTSPFPKPVMGQSFCSNVPTVQKPCPPKLVNSKLATLPSDNSCLRPAHDKGSNANVEALCPSQTYCGADWKTLTIPNDVEAGKLETTSRSPSSARVGADHEDHKHYKGNLLTSQNEDPKKHNWASVVKGDAGSSMHLSYVQPSSLMFEGKLKLKLPPSIVQKGVAN